MMMESSTKVMSVKMVEEKELEYVLLQMEEI
jgi:hypothetical protein